MGSSWPRCSCFAQRPRPFPDGDAADPPDDGGRTIIDALRTSDGVETAADGDVLS